MQIAAGNSSDDSMARVPFEPSRPQSSVRGYVSVKLRDRPLARLV